MVVIDSIYYRIVSTMPADRWDVCWEVDGSIERGPVVMWATIEAIYTYNRERHCLETIDECDTENNSRVVGMEISDGIVCCCEEVANFIGYCRSLDPLTGYEDQARKIHEGRSKKQ